MKKISFSLLTITILSFLFIYSCSTEEEDTIAPVVQTPQPEPETPAPTQYTITVIAGDGGSVTAGGTFDEGTVLTITASPNDGYEFIGWTGSEVTSNEVSITVNTNLTLTANFQLIQVATNYYSSGDIIAIEPVVFYDRELTINGIKLIVASEIGGQEAVPDELIYKTAQVFKLLIDKDSEGIDSTLPNNPKSLPVNILLFFISEGIASTPIPIVVIGF